MSIEHFFDHTCNIYHLQQTGKAPGFGLPSSPSFSYGSEPDEVSVPCHFAVKSSSVSITQTQPANMLDVKNKLTLPAGTDIRINDKVVWVETGLEFTAELPRNIRGHHLFAFLNRVGDQRPL